MNKKTRLFIFLFFLIFVRSIQAGYGGIDINDNTIGLIIFAGIICLIYQVIKLFFGWLRPKFKKWVSKWRD